MMYPDSEGNVVDVVSRYAEWNYQLLSLDVEPFTQRVPTHEELYTRTHTHTLSD